MTTDSPEVPEKLYMISADIGMKTTMFMLTSDRLDDADVEYILTAAIGKKLKKLKEAWNCVDFVQGCIFSSQFFKRFLF